MGTLDPMTSVLALTDASVVRRGRRILDDVSWQTRRAEHWVILGPNGAGKTTLVRAAAGRIGLVSGTALLDGEDLGQCDPAESRTRIGFVSHSVCPFIRGRVSARELVLAGAWGVNMRTSEKIDEVDEQRASDLLTAFGVDSVAEQEFSTLSEGEEQRVLLARALMTDPEVLILDEPTAGLDLGAREMLVGALEEIITGARAPQFILVTHQIEEIPSGMTHAALMASGRIRAAGPIDEVITGANLSDAYGLELEAECSDGRWRAHGAPPR